MTRLTVLLIVIADFLSGCGSSDNPLEQAVSWSVEGKIMGTYYRVLVANPPATALIGLKQLIEQQLIEDNQQISTWQENTNISRFNHYSSTKPWPITSGMADIISTSLLIGEKTGGAMDITIGSLVNLWGFGPEKQPKKTPNAQQIEKACAQIGLKYLRLIRTSKGQWLQKSVPNMYIDLSTVGEGYATDHLALLLEQRGIIRYLVSVGGAVLARGLSTSQQPWRVAIQHPTDESIVADSIVDLQGHGISTSGSYRNYYMLSGKRVSHVIDPIIGKPINHKLVSATVIATTALEADGWDTGLMVLGAEKAKQLALKERLAVFLITKTDHGFTTWMSPQFSSFIISHGNKDV